MPTIEQTSEHMRRWVTYPPIELRKELDLLERQQVPNIDRIRELKEFLAQREDEYARKYGTPEHGAIAHASKVDVKTVQA